MKSLMVLTLVLFSLISCTKKNPMAGNVGAFNNEVENQAQQEVEKSVEFAREGVAFDVLRQDCFKVATDANFSTEESEAVCLNANAHSQNCIEKALEVGLLKSSIAIICANAREGSATCLHNARIKDQRYSEEIAELCK